MTTTTRKRTPDLDLLRELSEARTYYEERFGWPVTIEVDPGRLVMRLGERLDAVVMPEPLGRGVLTDLRITLLAGPVLADTAGQWWLFLTQPSANCRPAPKDYADDGASRLRCLEVHPLPAGSRVVVPREIDETKELPWIERPRALHRLPPWRAVIATARRIGAQSPPAAAIPAQRDGGLARSR
ncbi:hypothetical protein [Actinocrispum sp. NPDC049592]|uniref:hypothetical protein n=1 Tax=Actinocrispum sp. NPDC049592 TaxID=3154835 RepID=UPI00341642CB